MYYLIITTIILAVLLIILSIFLYKMYKIIESKQDSKDKNSNNLQNDIDILQKKKEEFEKSIRELEYRKQSLEKELEKLQSQFKLTEEELIIKKREKENLSEEVNKIIEKARKDAEEINKKAIEKLDNISKEWENIQNQKQQLWEKEKQITVIQKELELKKQNIEEQQQKLQKLEQEIKNKENEINKIKESIELELQKIASLSPEQAKEIILNTLSRIASDSVSENTTYSIILPSEEYKGRLIGKEGRNIKAFEEVTGVDLIIDDNSDVVLVSSFDPIRREKARLTIEKLISIGKINPIAIQEVYDQVEKEINIRIQEEGENACLQAKVFDLHPDLVLLVGKMKYRASYGQNLLKHSIQVSSIAALLAAEIGANVEVCRRAAFLHDIGKVLDESNGEPHAIAGAKIAKIYGEKEEVVRAIASHHNEVPQETIEDLIVQIADAISASRPGARKETYQLYIQRLQKLEEVAMGFNGVEKAFVLQGGKEVIVFVKPEIVNDHDVYNLAKEISKAIENNLKYPGVIRVTVIRKVIAVQMAR